MKVKKSNLPLLLPGHAFEVMTSGNIGWATAAKMKVPGPHVGEPPTMDRAPDPEDERSEGYPDWTKDNSRVVQVHWVVFKTKDEAMAYFKKQYGHVYQDCSTAKYWAARVPKGPV